MRKATLIVASAMALMGCQAAASEDHLDDEYEAAAATLENQADALEDTTGTLETGANSPQTYGEPLSSGLSAKPSGQLDSQADALRREYDSSPYSSGLTFKGDDCLYDCSGHEAGYEWAEDKGIESPDDCGGKSQSFTEGCQAYATEQQEADSSEL